jgi:hypothetical protein
MKTASNELQPPATPPQNRLSRTRTGRKLKVYLRAIPPEMDDDGHEGNDVVAERDIGQGEGCLVESSPGRLCGRAFTLLVACATSESAPALSVYAAAAAPWRGSGSELGAVIRWR